MQSNGFLSLHLNAFLSFITHYRGKYFPEKITPPLFKLIFAQKLGIIEGFIRWNKKNDF